MTKNQRFGLLYFMLAMAIFVSSNVALINNIDGYWILYAVTIVLVIIGASMQDD